MSLKPLVVGALLLATVPAAAQSSTAAPNRQMILHRWGFNALGPNEPKAYEKACRGQPGEAVAMKRSGWNIAYAIFSLGWYTPTTVTVKCAQPSAPVAARHAPPVAVQSPAPAPAPIADNFCLVDRDCGRDHLCLDGACVRVEDASAKCFPTVHFDFDQAEIRDADRDSLVRTARCLRAAPGLHIIVEGHCDERGTTKYNDQLGDRRAKAVTAALQELGVSDEQLRDVSYGKARPVCVSHEETCYWHNRRGEVKAATDTASRPIIIE